MTSKSTEKNVLNIEKYDFDEYEKEQKPYAMILTHVIQNIKNAKAFLVWSYLQSKPEDWIPSKNQLIKHFEMSERGYQRVMVYLNQHKLIEYRRIRNSNGTLGKNKLIILNGLKFISDKDFDQTAKNDGVEKYSNNLEQSVQPNQTAKNPECGESTHVVFGDDTNTRDLTNNKIKETNVCDTKNSSFLVPINYQETYYKVADDCHQTKSIRFEEFWTLYPSKKNKNRAKAIWENSLFDDKADFIIEKLKIQIKDDAHWQDVKYIPNPSNYLNDQRWLDDITSKTNKSAPKNSSSTRYDHKSTDWIESMNAGLLR